FAILHRVIPHLLRKKHIAAKRFKHMLPGTDCFRTTDFYRFVGFQRLDAIGNDPIQSPVAATYHISGSYTSYTLAVFFIRSGMKEAPTPRGDGYFSRTFRRGIRIVSAHRLILPIA